jgi:uncharacterized repeat protein (TIGR03809 family)
MHDSPSTSWRPEALARKWHALAERRCRHLNDLYESGDWKRYFTEEVLYAHMREAAREAERWGAMLDDTATAATDSPGASATSPRAA